MWEARWAPRRVARVDPGCVISRGAAATAGGPGPEFDVETIDEVGLAGGATEHLQALAVMRQLGLLLPWQVAIVKQAQLADLRDLVRSVDGERVRIRARQPITQLTLAHS